MSPSSTEKGRGAALPSDLRAALDYIEGGLVLLSMAIEAGDPKAELSFRVNELLDEVRELSARATGESSK